MKVGFIGLGAMGRPMALNVLKGGHSLAVWARNPASVKPLVDAGAEVLPTPAALAAACDMVCTMVTATADVEHVLLGPDGVVHGGRPGLLAADMSTISPFAARRMAARLAERGIELLDAPVSGGVVGAEAATLSIMAGGTTAAFDRAKPVLACMGRTLVHIGESGAGQVAKAANQLFIVASLQGVAEAVALARAAGVDADRVLDALEKGAAGSRMLEIMGRRMANRDFVPGVESRLHHKDAGIVLDCAHEAGLALPLAALGTQTFNALMGQGGGRRDSSAIVAVVEGARAGASGGRDGSIREKIS